jgi:hypothetical protein
MKSRVSNLKAYRFSFFWTITAVILLSLIPEKKSRYLMPVLIPLAINIGFYLEYLIREFKNLKSKKETIPVYLQFGLIATLASLFWIVWFFSSEILTGIILVRFISTAVALLILGVLIFINLRLKHIKNVIYLVFTFMLILGLFALPLSKTHIQTNYKPVAQLKSQGLNVYSLDYISPEVIYNYGDKIQSISTNEGYLISNENQFYLLTNTVKPESIESLTRLYTIEFLETYDLNYPSEDSKGYKSRLVNQLYKMSRK